MKRRPVANGSAIVDLPEKKRKLQKIFLSPLLPGHKQFLQYFETYWGRDNILVGDMNIRTNNNPAKNHNKLKVLFKK